MIKVKCLCGKINHVKLADNQSITYEAFRCYSCGITKWVCQDEEHVASTIDYACTVNGSNEEC